MFMSGPSRTHRDVLLVGSDDVGLGGWLELGLLLDADADADACRHKENVVRNVVRAEASNVMSIRTKLILDTLQLDVTT